MSTVASTTDPIALLRHIIIENLDTSDAGLKEEVHRKKTERMAANELFKVGGGDNSLDKGVRVTSYTLPTVRSEQEPDLKKAEKYLDSEEFDKTMKAVEPTFTTKMFGRGFDLFVLIRDMGKTMRSDASLTGAAITKLRDSLNQALKENIQRKGREALAIGITGAVAGMAVSAAGTSKLLKTSNTARTDLKNTNASLPKQEAALKSKESALTKLDPKKKEDRPAIGVLKNEIRDDKGAIEEMQFKANLAQSKADSNMSQGMAVQSMGQGVSGVFAGIGEGINANNEVAVVGAETSGQMLQELSQKTGDLANEQKDLMKESLQTMSLLTQLDSQMYGNLAGNIK